MSKLTLNNLANLTNENTAVATINANNDSIEAAMDSALFRNGISPNQMNSVLDMNSNRIINLPAPVSGSEPVRLQDLSTSTPANVSAAAAAASATIATTQAGIATTQAGLATAATLRLGVLPSRYSSTNTLNIPTFNGEPWGVSKATGEMINFGYDGNSLVAGNAFGNRIAQINNNGTACFITHPTNVCIDATKAYRVGVWGYGNGNIQAVITPFNNNNGDLTPIALNLSLPATADLSNGEVISDINAVGGGGTAWPVGTVGARFALKNNDASTNRFILSAYLIQQGKLPTTVFTKINGGGGTHEAYFDGTNLFTVSHSYNKVTKYDTNLNWLSERVVDNYPHDITVLGNNVWVVSQVAQKLIQIDKTSMAILNTYTITGSRGAMGIANDGTNLYIGAGETASPVAAIIKFTVAGATQSVLNNTDVFGGVANLPVRYLAGSVWSVNTTNSQVKRIHPTTGALVASISCNIGLIFGLGDDGTLLYVNGEQGIVVIDPATNTIVGTYPFTRLYNGASNCRADIWGRMWGCTSVGAWMLDHANARLYEMPTNIAGGPKWFHQMGNKGMAMGYYAMPSIDLFR